MNITNIIHRETDSLVPFAGNARTHPEHQLEQLCQNIQRFGFYNPVLTDEHGTIIAGHGRVMAAKRMGLATVPTIVIEGLGESERRALTLADNRIQMNASWDMEKVREELSALADEDFDLSFTGFSDGEIESLLSETMDILPNIESEYVSTVPTVQQREQTPTVGDESEEPREPRASDDDYSRFDLVMTHSNKVELVELLSQIRADQMYDTLEEAVMDLVKFWKENK
jgi:ParB-like chromosome segregation protein Spo0J